MLMCNNELLMSYNSVYEDIQEVIWALHRISGKIRFLELPEEVSEERIKSNAHLVRTFFNNGFHVVKSPKREE